VSSLKKYTLKKRLSAFLIMLGLIIGTVVVAMPAQAASPGDIISPFNTGQSACIMRGYSHASHGTGTTSQYGLDLVAGNCNSTSATGLNVRASLAGTVSYWQPAYGNLCINVSGGRSISYTHINASVTSGSVALGQSIGTVAAAQPIAGAAPQNNNVAHLHFQIWNASGCYNSSVIPFDSAHGARICGAPNLIATGSGSNGVWSSTVFTGDSCGAAAGSGGFQGVGSATLVGGSARLMGEQILSNQYMVSANGWFALVMQTDGNLVEYSGASGAIWNSGTGGNPGARLVMQYDGNIVIYNSANAAIWSSGTSGVNKLQVQDDGNIVAYNSSNQAKWNSGTTRVVALTYQATTSLFTGEQLHGGYFIRLDDSRYWLAMQGDGNLVLYGPGAHILWNSGTGGNLGAYLVMQYDGNIVIYNSANSPIWATGTNDAVSLGLQYDGNLVVKNSSNNPVWATGTSGQI
jgi:hypothetical protein